MVNKSQFRRLLLVLLFPLLLLGILLMESVLPEPEPERHLCERSGNGEQMCFAWWPQHWTRLSDAGLVTADVDINALRIQESTFDTFAVSRVNSPIQVVSVTMDSDQGPGAEAPLQQLAGQSASVRLGTKKEERGGPAGGFYYLACDNLTFLPQLGEYTSRCRGDTWSGTVKYRALGEVRAELDGLLAAIKTAIQKSVRKRNVLLAYKVVLGYPILIYAFLLMSLIYWVVMKAARFVKNG